MAWTHYTEPLSSGQMITAAQLMELWNAFRERVDAYIASSYNANNWTKFADSGIVSDNVGRITGSAGPSSMLSQIRSLSQRYLVSDTSPLAWAQGSFPHPWSEISEGNIFWKAAQDLGFTETTFNDLFEDNSAVESLDFAERWNIMRRCIQKMEWVEFSVRTDTLDYTTFLKVGTRDPSWSVAKSNFLSATEDAIVTGPRHISIKSEILGNGDHVIRGRRCDFTDSADIPANDLFDPYDLRAFFRTTADNNFGGPFELAFGSEVIAGTSPATASTNFFIEKTAITQGGTITPSFQFTGYNDSTELDHWERITEGLSRSEVLFDNANLLRRGIFLKPAFSYGEDPP